MSPPLAADQPRLVLMLPQSPRESRQEHTVLRLSPAWCRCRLRWPRPVTGHVPSFTGIVAQRMEVQVGVQSRSLLRLVFQRVGGRGARLPCPM